MTRLGMNHNLLSADPFHRLNTFERTESSGIFPGSKFTANR